MSEAYRERMTPAGVEQRRRGTAWLWNLDLGHDRVEWKATPRFARVVRGEPTAIERVKD